MARYDGLIIPRSYSEYINKTDGATLSQALQLSGVMDNAPTEDSEKPTKSGGIYDALQSKQPTLTFDDVPTENSDNPVKSGGLVNTVPVDEVTSGNMKPATSNAVAAAVAIKTSNDGFNANFGTGYCRSRRIGSLCIVSVYIDQTTAPITTADIFCTIPADFRPKTTSTAINGYVKLNGSVFSYANNFITNTQGQITQNVTGTLPIGTSINVLFVYEGV